jgi:hypothetical protein
MVTWSQFALCRRLLGDFEMTKYASEVVSNGVRFRYCVLGFLLGVAVSLAVCILWYQSRLNRLYARLEPWGKSEVALALFRHLGADVYLSYHSMHERFWSGAGFGVINMSGLNLTDADLAMIAGASDIVTLNLSGTKVTDACLPALAALPDLRYLNVRGTKVTDEGLRRFSTIAPQCRVNEGSWDEIDTEERSEKAPAKADKE